MTNEKPPCLYCQTPNDANAVNCTNCGMALAKNHPNSAKSRSSFFIKAFWAIVIFCIVMIIYLPR
jgi:uncharacterized paraquat-inducible protein A